MVLYTIKEGNTSVFCGPCATQIQKKYQNRIIYMNMIKRRKTSIVDYIED